MSLQAVCSCSQASLWTSSRYPAAVRSTPFSRSSQTYSSLHSSSFCRNVSSLQHRRQTQCSRRLQRVTPQAGIFGLGLPEVAVITGVAVLIFGPSKLPELGKELGKSVKSFQSAAKEFENELKESAKDDDKTPVDDKK
ncbi:hypothetical protein WJX74_004989 [Apatococcus lobatus]|uniref:Sec-independent protein translocase protein TatA n=1 Tax=Apatococcus lobatus TaxID=904363 RepID=A0AAW1RWM9_9CHLO